MIAWLALSYFSSMEKNNENNIISGAHVDYLIDYSKEQRPRTLIIRSTIESKNISHLEVFRTRSSQCTTGGINSFRIIRGEEIHNTSTSKPDLTISPDKNGFIEFTYELVASPQLETLADIGRCFPSIIDNSVISISVSGALPNFRLVSESGQYQSIESISIELGESLENWTLVEPYSRGKKKSNAGYIVVTQNDLESHFIQTRNVTYLATTQIDKLTEDDILLVQGLYEKLCGFWRGCDNTNQNYIVSDILDTKIQNEITIIAEADIGSSRIFRTRGTSRTELLPIIAHEMTHRWIPRSFNVRYKRTPAWLYEGFTDYISIQNLYDLDNEFETVFINDLNAAISEITMQNKKSHNPYKLGFFLAFHTDYSAVNYDLSLEALVRGMIYDEADERLEASLERYEELITGIKTSSIGSFTVPCAIKLKSYWKLSDSPLVEYKKIKKLNNDMENVSCSVSIN